MKQWPSQLFGIALLGLLAALTFWLQSTVNGEQAADNGKLRHDPDAAAENFVVRRFDQNGIVRYRLSGPAMVHYADDDSSELRDPVLVSYRPAAADVTVNGRHAKVSSKGETIYLWEDVRITRAATADRPELVATMPDLVAQPEAGTAFTNSPLEVVQGQSRLTGVGAQFDNNTSTLVVQSQVRATYLRPSSKPNSKPATKP